MNIYIIISSYFEMSRPQFGYKLRQKVDFLNMDLFVFASWCDFYFIWLFSTLYFAYLATHDRLCTQAIEPPFSPVWPKWVRTTFCSEAWMQNQWQFINGALCEYKSFNSICWCLLSWSSICGRLFATIKKQYHT